MGHNPQSIMDIYEIIRRWHTGGSIRGIARRLQIDRKTVRRYLKQAQQLGVSRDQPLPEAQLLREKLARIVPSRKRTRPARQQLEPNQEEILALIDDPEEPVTLKSAWKVIRHRYPHITASYSALKRVVRDWQPNRRPATWRHETPPGLQTQLDYGKVGLLHDPVADRRRALEKHTWPGGWAMQPAGPCGKFVSSNLTSC